MPFIHVGQENSGNIEIYYEDHGSGDPVVLIHGWPLSSSSWEKQVPALLSAGYRVITYDRRGFGKSSQPSMGYNYDTLCKDLDMLLSKLELTNVTLVGFSMGGGEVARYLGTYGTTSVKKAVFVGSITPFFLKTSDHSNGMDQELFENIKRGLAADRPDYLSKFFMKFFNMSTLVNQGMSENIAHLSWIVACGASPKGTMDCVTAWMTDFREDVARIDIPTLIVHGDSDKIVPIEASGQRMPTLIKGSTLRVFKDAPHGLTWTHAEQFNRELLRFMSEQKA